MKRKLGLSILSVFALLGLVSCGENTPTTESQTTTPTETPTTPTEIVEESFYDVPVDPENPYDHYFSNKVNFASTKTKISKNNDGNIAGDFIKDGVAKLVLKSVTDGDTAVFYLTNYEGESTNTNNNKSFTPDTFTVKNKTYPYVTIRFQGIDTPESTSAIDPWGKAASNYAKSLLESAEGIIVDASDLKELNEAERNYSNRVDSNGTRWVAQIWYCPKGGNPQDLSQYRSYQLDLIEECYSEGVYFNSSIYAYTADYEKEPLLYSRFDKVTNLVSGEIEERFGSLKLGELFYEAGNRMAKCSKKLRVHGETDPKYDETLQVMTITEAYQQMDSLIEKGAYVELKGVITRYISNNFYMQDENGSALYVYMGIDGNSISSTYKVGDTIKIRGRLCEYGGQYQMSGIVFKKSTFVKVTDPAEVIPMPAPIDLDNLPEGSEYNIDFVKSCLGKLVTKKVTVVSSRLSVGKDGSFSLTDTNVIPGLETVFDELGNDADLYYGTEDQLQVRINGTLAPGYDIKTLASGNVQFTAYAKTYQVTGIMGIYQETDLTKPKIIPSYQIVVGNRDRADADGNSINEIVEITQ